MMSEREMSDERFRRFEEEVRRNFRWNFAVNCVDFGLFTVALSFASVATILPAFVKHFTASSVLIGAVAALSTLGWFLPQLLVAGHIERLERKKPFILRYGIGERLPWLVLALVTFLFRTASASWMLGAFFVLYGWYTFSGGIVGNAWLDMVAKAIPERRRGAFFGTSRFAGGVLGVLGGLLAGHLLERYAFPGNFGRCFLLTFAFTSTSLVFFSLNREPVYPVQKEHRSFWAYLRRLPEVLRRDPAFARLLGVGVLLSFGGMGSGFYAVHAIDRLGLESGKVGTFTAFLLAAQTVTNLPWGYLGDRKGYKCVMVASAICGILAALVAAVGGSLLAFYGVFVLLGASWSSGMIAASNIVLEFCRPEDRPTYIGLAGTIRAPFMGLAPILGGILADRFGYPFVFLVTAGILLVGLVALSVAVRDPRSVKGEG